MVQTFDAVIIGGGIAGSSMAFALAAMGWSALLIDQHTFPRHKVCGEFLSPESQHILTALGLSEYIEPLHPVPIHAVRLISAGGISLELPLPGAALGISRYKLDYQLHRAAIGKGVTIQTGVTVSSVCRHERGYKIETVQPQERSCLEARVVIGAWGRHVRAGLAGQDRPATGEGRPLVGVKAHFKDVHALPIVELYFFTGGYIGLSPVEGGIVNAAALLTREAFTRAGKTVTGVMEAAARLHPGFRERLGHGTLVPDSAAAVAPVTISRRPIPWGIGPHVGDAAVVLPPLCGDGMAVALKSAELCARYADLYLHGALTLSEWRTRYTNDLNAVCSGPLRWGRLLQRLLGKPAVSGLLLQAGKHIPGLAGYFVRATRLSE